MNLEDWLKANDKAWDVYHADMLEARTERDAAFLAFRDKSECPCCNGRYTNSEAVEKVRVAFKEKRTAISAERSKAQDDAWQKLAETYTDPVSLWIIQNCVGSKHEAAEALKFIADHGKFSLMALDTYAVSVSWCEAYEEYRALAFQQGVVTSDYSV